MLNRNSICIAYCVIAYSWLDFAVGSDTTGSTRRPSLWNGLFSIRPTTGLLAQDGFVPTMLEWDILSLFTRDIRLLRLITANWYIRPCIPRTLVSQESILLYPTDFYPLENAAQMKILDGVVDQMATTMSVQVRSISIKEEWAKTGPVAERNLTKYLENMIEKTFYYDANKHFAKFRADSQAAGNFKAFLSPITRIRWSIAALITEDQHVKTLERLRIFKEWFLANILQTQRQDAYMVLPIEDLKPTYRDELPLPPTEFPQGIDHLTLCPCLGAAEVTVPAGQITYTSRITKRKERLPVVVSVMGPPESDHKLLAWVEEFMRRSGKRLYVTTGKTMYGDEDSCAHMEELLDSRASRSEPNPHTVGKLVAKTPYYNTPRISYNFESFERPDLLSRLDDLIATRSPYGSKIVLEGHGGIGKTTVAKQFAQLRKRSFDVIVWLPCASITGMNEALVTIVEDLGLNTNGNRLTYTSCRRLFEEWLSCPRQDLDVMARWLLVLDNVVDTAFLGDLCNVRPTGSTLMTSRDITAAGLSPVNSGRRIQVEPFDSSTAAKILQKLTDTSAEDDESMKNMAKSFASQALPIRLLAAMIQHQKVNFADALVPFQRGTGVPENRAFDLIFGAVFTSLSSDAQTTLTVICLMDYTNLADELVQAILLAVCSTAWLPVREELLATGLLETQGQGFLGVHHLIAKQVLSMITDHTKFFNIAAAVLHSKWPYERVRNELLYTNECGVLITHIFPLHKLYIGHLDELHDHTFINLVACAGCYMMERGDLIKAIDLCEQCYALDSRSWQTLRTLQSSYSTTNRADKTLEYATKLLDLAVHNHEMLPSESSRVNLVVAYREMGIACFGNDSLNLGIQFCETSLTEAGKLEDSYAKEVDPDSEDLGSPFEDLDGRFENLNDSFQDSMTGVQSREVGHHKATNLTIVNLALGLWLQGQLDRAEHLLRDLLEDLRSNLVPVRRFTLARCLYALGNVCESSGDIDRAEVYHCEALRIFIHNCGISHHRTANVAFRVARHDIRHGKYNDALEKLLTAKYTWESQSALFIPEQARVNYLLGYLNDLIGDEDAAQRYRLKAHDLYRELRHFYVRALSELGESNFDALVLWWCK